MKKTLIAGLCVVLLATVAVVGPSIAQGYCGPCRKLTVCTGSCPWLSSCVPAPTSLRPANGAYDPNGWMPEGSGNCGACLDDIFGIPVGVCGPGLATEAC